MSDVILHNLSNITAATNPVNTMGVINSELTGGLLSIFLSVLTWGLIISIAYNNQQSETYKDYKKSVFGASWLSIILNLFFIYPLNLITYKILFFYVVTLILSYITMQRDTS